MSVAREEDDLRTNCEPTLLFEAPLAVSSRGFDCLFCSAADAVGRSVAGQSLTRRGKSAAKHPNSHELVSSLSSQHCSLVQKSKTCRSFFHEHNHHFPILRYPPTASPQPKDPLLSRHPHKTPLFLPRLQFGPPETAVPAGPICVEGISG